MDPHQENYFECWSNPDQLRYQSILGSLSWDSYDLRQKHPSAPAWVFWNKRNFYPHSSQSVFVCVVCSNSCLEHSVDKRLGSDFLALDSGVSALDSGFLALDTGFLALDTGFLAPDFGFSAIVSDFFALDSGL